MRRPMKFTPPQSPEQHGAAIVHLQSCTEELDTRLATAEAFIEAMRRLRERAAWAAAMALLALANFKQEVAIDLFAKVFVALLGG